jgi:multidrug resistance efflux pump
MPAWVRTSGRVAVTIAVLVGWRMWVHYELEPWTRDGRVRADIVQVAPDISGLVTEVAVGDNQPVRRGQLLFVLDRPRYQLALARAEATVASDQATLAETAREARRDAALRELVSQEAKEQARARADQARAALAQAVAARDEARLNLARTTVVAPVDGILSSVTLRPGAYLPAGRAALAIIDQASLRVDGYFEETKLPRIRIGDRASVKIMGQSGMLYGHVESIAPAIADRERSESSDLLPNVNPTFSWVRLAQRIPVRIVLDRVPPDVRLIAGRTATVSILPTLAHAAAPRR